MAIILRTHIPDSSGLDAWYEDPDTGKLCDTPVHFHDGVFDEAGVDAVIAQRAATKALEAKLTKVRAAGDMVLGKISGLIDDALVYVQAYPDVTGDQLKTAFVNQLKTWAANWNGD